MAAVPTMPIQTYRVVVHEAEEGGYWGEVLELPGCVSQGETLDEFNHNIKEAIEAVLYAQTEDGRVEIVLEPTLTEKDTFQFVAREPFNALLSTTETSTWTASQ